MENTVTLNLQTVQGTMLLPLWGRAKYSKENTDILDDGVTVDIVENLNVDFGEIERSFGEFGGLCYIFRARRFDDEVRAFIKTHPRATIVNIGSGLDTGFSRVDNGTIRWYDLDLPDAVRYRQSLIPDSARSTCIPKSFFDLSWLDDIDCEPRDGVLFLSAGVLYYFEEKDISRVVKAMAERFPGGALYFDAETKRAVSFSNRMVRKSGNNGAMMHFYVNDAQALKGWSPNIKRVTSERYFNGVPRKKSWSTQTRMRMSMLDALGMMKYVKIEF